MASHQFRVFERVYMRIRPQVLCTFFELGIHTCFLRFVFLGFLVPSAEFRVLVNLPILGHNFPSNCRRISMRMSMRISSIPVEYPRRVLATANLLSRFGVADIPQ